MIVWRIPLLVSSLSLGFRSIVLTTFHCSTFHTISKGRKKIIVTYWKARKRAPAVDREVSVMVAMRSISLVALCCICV